MSDTILVSRDADGHVARVVLNRPEKLNCVSTAMWSGLADIFRELDADPRLEGELHADDDAPGQPPGDVCRGAAQEAGGLCRLRQVRFERGAGVSA